MSKDQKPTPPQGKTAATPSKKATDGTEADLWDLDSDLSGTDSTQVESQDVADNIPARRETTSNIRSRKPTKREIEVPIAPAATPSADPETDELGDTLDAPVSPAPPTADDEEPDAEEEDPSDSGAPVNPPKLPSFTKTERIAVSALFGALALAAVMAISFFSNRVPTRPIIPEKPDFPISGKLIEIRSASTYWRKPITTGDNPETVRRGTAFIPVLRLSLHSESCAIRIFFRDQDGVVVGDAINRLVSGDQDIEIPATAGFDDIGMHAAYRTGEQLPWTVHILEGPSRSADRKDFRKILETQVSTDVR